VLCGVCRGAGEPWAAVALAAHPGGFTRHALVAPAAGEPSCFGAVAGDILRGSADGLRVRLGEDAWVDLRLRSPLLWPGRVFGALGPAQVVPGLGQYWHPVVLAARADGEARLGGVRLRLDGATAYAEKNWRHGFAGHWWWGHADSFPSSDATVAFAGGRLGLAGRVVSPTAVVMRLGRDLISRGLGAPLRGHGHPAAGLALSARNSWCSAASFGLSPLRGGSAVLRSGAGFMAARWRALLADRRPVGPAR
jgi:tocopherol cyclase